MRQFKTQLLANSFNEAIINNSANYLQQLDLFIIILLLQLDLFIIILLQKLFWPDDSYSNWNYCSITGPSTVTAISQTAKAKGNNSTPKQEAPSTASPAPKSSEPTPTSACATRTTPSRTEQTAHESQAGATKTRTYGTKYISSSTARDPIYGTKYAPANIYGPSPFTTKTTATTPTHRPPTSSQLEITRTPTGSPTCTPPTETHGSTYKGTRYAPATATNGSTDKRPTYIFYFILF